MLKPILLVEDNPRDRELTLVALERSNLANEVVAVHDGAEALDFLRRTGVHADRTAGNPAVILMDIKMPKVSGLEVLEVVRADPALHSIPVVILTSSNMEKDVLQAYTLGGNAYVVKPLDLGEFMRAVSGVGGFWGVLNEPPPGSTRVARKIES